MANKKKQIKLTESGLRNFVSYSVARFLKEAYDFQGKEIIRPNGESDGYEGSDYGSSSIEVSISEWMENEYKGNAPRLIEYVNKKNGGKFTEIIRSESSSVDAFLNCLEDLPEDAFMLEVSFTYAEGMKSHDYNQPDDSDELTIDNKQLKNTGAIKMIQDPQMAGFVSAVVKEWPEWVDEDYIMKNYIESSLYEERNLGVTTHFDGKSSFKPENPYGDMTWNEYVEAKSREKDQPKVSSEDKPIKNLGTTAHFNGKKHEETPEGKESAEHMFDDDYWARKQGGANKINITRDELSEMINRCVKRCLNEISMGLLDRAREAAHKDMMRNFGDSKIRNKRSRQWKKFGDEYRRMDQEEKDSICPQVDERDLANMPEDTYVVLNGDGRDAVNADFRTSYSGRAGTKEQCKEYVKRFYDKGANWEHLPEIMPLKEYLNSKRRR